MKTGKICPVIGIPILLLIATGCAKSEIEPTPETVIRFAPQSVRATVIDLGDGDSFAVWARESSNGTPNMILTQEEVYCTNNIWSYNNLKYWKIGATYDFYALYPHNTPNAQLDNINSDVSPKMTVSDFDASKAVDLMAAEQPDLAYSGNPSPVTFNFRHLLSKVEIIGQIDPALVNAGISGKIVAAKLYGLPATGTCTIDIGSYGSWEMGSATTSDAPFCTTTEGSLSTTGTSLFGEMLPIPQTISNDCVLELVYQYTDTNLAQTQYTKTIHLINAGVSAWEPSMSYRYTFTLGNDYILFDTPEVSPWRSASGGIITIE